MELRITCSAKNCIDYHSIVPIQGNLKRRGDRDIEKLCKSIIELGISYPFAIWKHDQRYWCIDGHGRLLAFAELEKQGYTIPPVPIIEVFATNKEGVLKQDYNPDQLYLFPELKLEPPVVTDTAILFYLPTETKQALVKAIKLQNLSIKGYSIA